MLFLFPETTLMQFVLILLKFVQLSLQCQQHHPVNIEGEVNCVDKRQNLQFIPNIAIVQLFLASVGEEGEDKLVAETVTDLTGTFRMPTFALVLPDSCRYTLVVSSVCHHLSYHGTLDNHRTKPNCRFVITIKQQKMKNLRRSMRNIQINVHEEKVHCNWWRKHLKSRRNQLLVINKYSAVDSGTLCSVRKDWNKSANKATSFVQKLTVAPFVNNSTMAAPLVQKPATANFVPKSTTTTFVPKSTTTTFVPKSTTTTFVPKSTTTTFVQKSTMTTFVPKSTTTTFVNNTTTAPLIQKLPMTTFVPKSSTAIFVNKSMDASFVNTTDPFINKSTTDTFVQKSSMDTFMNKSMATPTATAAIKTPNFDQMNKTIAKTAETYANRNENNLTCAVAASDHQLQRPLDIVLLLDGSGSISTSVFYGQILHFARELAQNLNISSNGAHLAIVQFSDRPQLEFGLNSGDNAQTIKSKIDSISYIDGGTNIGRALLFAYRVIMYGARNNSDKIVVVVTDGVSSDDVSLPAINLRRLSNAELIAIGIGEDIEQRQLNLITGNPRKVYALRTFDQLDAGLVTRSIQKC